MNRIKLLLHFLLYTVLQMVVLYGSVGLRDNRCFAYVGLLLLLPYRDRGAETLLHLWIGFGMGVFMDLFYHSLGVHAFSSVLLVYGRALLLPYFSLPNRGYWKESWPTLQHMGWKRFVAFSTVTITIHQFSITVLYAWGTSPTFAVIQQTFVGIVLTLGIILCLQTFTLFIRR